MTNRESWHFYMATICAETEQHEAAAYHRLEYEAEQLQRRLDTYSVFHPWVWMLLFRAYRLDARLHAAWRKTQTQYGDLP